MAAWCIPVFVTAASLLLIPYSPLSLVEGGKLLVVPFDGSHWLSMRPVVDLLSQRGHEVVVVAPEISIHLGKSQNFEMKMYPVSYSEAELKNHFTSFAMEVFTPRPLLQKFQKIRQKLKEGAALMMDTCIHMLNNSQLIKYLEESSFDALFTDPMLPCGQILAEHLSLPSIFFLRGIPCNLDTKASQCPLPISYVPRMFSGSTDHMTFIERLKNFILELSMHALCDVVYSPYKDLASGFLQRDVTVEEILSHGAIWLMRQDFVLEFPKPVMPNMVFIGGINCVLRKPLTQVEMFVFSKIGILLYCCKL